jgi:IS30 family transposase
MNYNQLTQSQRYRIEILLSMGHSYTAIAHEIGVHKSTVSREVRRNWHKGRYQAQTAIHLTFNRHKTAAKYTKHSPTIVQFVRKTLTQKQWSPEQISHSMKRKLHSWVSHEWIYRYVWHDKRQGGQLFQHLRTRHKRYRKRYATKPRQRIFAGSKHISLLPEIANLRQRIGDWEIDTVLGKTGQSVLVTAVDHKSRYLLVQLAPRKTSDAVLKTLLAMYQSIKRKVYTITCDNGAEFSQHRLLAKKLKADVYFCTPYHSWQRGTNENTNGHIRQYFPKSTNFDLLKPKEVKRVMDKLNRRSLKTLNFNTPKQVFLNETILSNA